MVPVLIFVIVMAIVFIASDVYEMRKINKRVEDINKERRQQETLRQAQEMREKEAIFNDE